MGLMETSSPPDGRLDPVAPAGARIYGLNAEPVQYAGNGGQLVCASHEKPSGPVAKRRFAASATRAIRSTISAWNVRFEPVRVPVLFGDPVRGLARGGSVPFHGANMQGIADQVAARCRRSPPRQSLLHPQGSSGASVA